MVGFIIGATLAIGGGAEPSVNVTKANGQNTLKFENGLVIRRTSAAISGARAMGLPGSPVQIALWNEVVRGKSTPHYAISLDGSQVERVTNASYDIKIRYGAFDPAKGAPSVPSRLKGDESNEMFIVQFVSQPLQEMRDVITAIGGTIRDYLPEHAYIVQMTREQREELSGEGFVRAITPFEPAFRVEDWVRDRLLSNTLKTLRYNIQLFESGPEAQARVSALIEMLGGRVDGTEPESRYMTVTLSPLQLEQLLHSNDISFIDRWSAPGQDMDNIKVVVGQNAVNAVSTFGTFLGQGVKGAVMDGGLRTTHLAFLPGRLEIKGAVTTDSHGTATYGINFGDGDGNIAGTGMLPFATGVITAYSGYLNGNAARYAHTADLLVRGAMYESNSWGDAQTTVYTTISAQMDDILFQNDITILQSQSNLGDQRSRPQAWSKNMVSIGALNHFNNTNPDDDRWQNGASVGPAQDGRIKPDLANAYDSTLTTTSTNDTAYTTSFGGTSGATPITAGCFGVMFQMWGMGIFGNAVPAASHFLNRPKAALGKAIMINTAKQWSMVTPSDATRVRQGWGRAALDNIYNLRNNMFFVNEEVSLNNLQTATYKLYVPAGEPSIKVSMVYKDPAGTTSATLHRKNNLSLRVTSPTGTVYWGNAGLTAGPWSTSGGAEDNLNTVENVYVQNPGSGAWTVEVIGSDINTDADPTVAGNNARFAVAASGVRHSIQATAFETTPGSLSSGNLASIAYSDNSRMSLVEPTAFETTDAYRDLIIETTLPGTTCSQLGILAELNTAISTGQAQVAFFNWNTNAYEVIGGISGPIIAGDGVLNIAAVGASNYIQSGTQKAKARIRISDTSLTSESLWIGGIDLVRFHYQP